MGFMAERAANRMGMRQRYRTASRMQRRRSWMESKMGMRQDFEPKEEPVEAAPPSSASAAPAAAPVAPEPEYIAELERLAQLREQGIVSEEEFQAKKKQLLGL